MDFSAIDGLRSLNTDPRATAGAKSINQLNQTDFMTMMLAQLKAQDPFKPTDNGEFLAQMAQLSSATGIAEVKSAIENLDNNLKSMQILNASTLVGREVVMPSDTAVLSEPGDLRGQALLLGYAQDVRVEILTPGGAVLRQQSLGEHYGGQVPFEVKGLPAGSYQVRITASTNGRTEALSPELKAKVSSVSVSATGAEPLLHLQGMGSLLLSQVREIS